MANPNMAAWLESKLSKISDIIKESAEEVAEKGENVTKYHIETRGTDRSWSGDFGSFPNGISGKTSSGRGRVGSGLMRDSVSGKVSGVTKVSATASFGWLQGTPDYAMYQELGFTHNLSGKKIEGMYALSDAREEIVADLKEDLRSRLRGL